MRGAIAFQLGRGSPRALPTMVAVDNSMKRRLAGRCRRSTGIGGLLVTPDTSDIYGKRIGGVRVLLPAQYFERRRRR